jgi:hypothetical protein
MPFNRVSGSVTKETCNLCASRIEPRAESEGDGVKSVPMRAWMVKDAGGSPAKHGSCSNMSMFKAWLCRHVGLETSKVRRLVLGLVMRAVLARVSIYKC